MTTIRDKQLGELVLRGGEFCTTIAREGRKVPIEIEIEIEDVDGLAQPIDLLPVKLDDMLAGALTRARSEDESSVEMYVEHHLDQLEPEQWEKVLPEGTKPTADAVRASLNLRKIWGSYDEDGLNLNLDHGLPVELTDYVIVVRIDAEGEIDDVSMES